MYYIKRMFIFHVCLYQEKFWLHCISLQEELLLWILSGSNYHVFFWLQNLSGLCAAIWNQFSEENQLRVESHWNESWVISEGRAWSAEASFRFIQMRTPIRTTALNASGCRSHLWRNELVWRRNLVAEARFSFLRMAWIQGGSTPAYNKCSWWVVMLK